MRILITGACGFVGSTLAECLLSVREGVSVHGIDNFLRPGSELNRARLRELGVAFRHGDVRLWSDFEALPACDWVIDAAANPSVLAGVAGAAGSRQLMEHNLQGMVNVLEYCKLHRAGLILLSTSRVYSIAALCALPLREDGNAFQLDVSKPLPAGATENGIAAGFSTAPPVSLYGSTKIASEALALEYGEAFGFPVWIDRCGVLAGTGQFGTPDQGIFSYWINAHLRRRPLVYIGFDGTGRQTRDLFHPRDLATLVAAQMNCGRAGGRRIYTAGGGPGNALSLAGLTEWCDGRFGAHPVTADRRPRVYDIPWVAMDNGDAARDFGWQLTAPAAAILEEIAGHAVRNPDWLERSGV